MKRDPDTIRLNPKEFEASVDHVSKKLGWPKWIVRALLRKALKRAGALSGDVPIFEIRIEW